MSSLKFSAIRKSYGATAVVHGLDLVIGGGEFIVILGPSGCGKSTLLRMVAGLEPVTSGDIVLDGERINEREPRDRGCAMVFQNYALYPHMTVAGNIEYALKVAGVSREERQRRVAVVAETLGLTEYLDRKPANLSGGQRQRVAMGRAIIREPKVFLFDEPLSNLDAQLRIQMRIEIRKLHNRLSPISIFVTHDQMEAMSLADRIVVMNKGLIEQVGTPHEIYHRPATRFVAGFVGSPPMNIMPANVTETGIADIEGLSTRIAVPGLAASGKFEIGLRPEEVLLTDDGAGLRLHVDVIEELGPARLLHGRVGNYAFAAETRSHDIRVGDVLPCSFPPERLHVFDRATQRRVV